MSTTLENAFVSIPYMYIQAPKYGQPPQNGVSFSDVVRKTLDIIACHCRQKNPYQTADDATLLACCFHKAHSPLYVVRDSSRDFAETYLDSLDPERREKTNAILNCFKTEPCIHSMKSERQFWHDWLKWASALPMAEAKEILISRTVAEFMLLTQNPNISSQYRQEYMRNCMPVLNAIKDVRPNIYAFAVRLREGRIPEELAPKPLITKPEIRRLPPGARYMSTHPNGLATSTAHGLELPAVNAIA